MQLISIFKNILQAKDGKEVELNSFLNAVKFGQWKEITENINAEKDKKTRGELKKKGVPYVTPSGTFERRKADALIKHSGFICLDIDDLGENLEAAAKKLEADPFTYAVFRSISGQGLAVFVPINPKRHLDAFLGLESYYGSTYGLHIDRSCKDVSRARFVSYDPNLFLNEEAKKFENYLVKEKPKKLPTVITGDNDVKYIIDQITSNGIDLTRSEYKRYLEIGFSLASEFGETGREYYHAITQYSEKYSYKGADRQYNHCLKSQGSGVTYGTFLHYAKEAGVSLVSPETKHASTLAIMGKKGGRDEAAIIAHLVGDGIEEKVATEITRKVYSRGDVDTAGLLGKIETLELFLTNNYSLKRNEITRYIEDGGKEVDTNHVNSIFIRAKKEVDEKVKFDDIDRLINSDFTEDYNPLKNFFEAGKLRTETGLIEQLASSIITDTGINDDYTALFFKKWLVGMVASVFGQHSPLLLCLTGGQGTGKTEFFRRLFPAEVADYYAESKLDAGKDDEILCTQKLLILDDEFSGKSKNEAKRLKELTSKAYFTLREPYGRKNVRLKRLAVLAGTSNDEHILSDPTGNRRIIPIRILQIAHGVYNSVDKKALFMEAYKLYKDGYNWQLTSDEIALLNRNTGDFEQIRSEKEMLLRYFRQPEEDEPADYLQATEIKAYIERLSQQRLSVPKLGQELKALGFERISKKINGSPRKVYSIKKVQEEELQTLDGEGGTMNSGGLSEFYK